MRWWLLLLFLWCVSPSHQTVLRQLTGVSGHKTDENEAIRFLQRYDVTASHMCNAFMEASWRYNTNVTEYNRRVMVSQQLQ
ncbi:angiotensin-converting enzyme-like protein Ace3 [Hyalella azteca]|uniref:Angiotensin-converting enzyme-like protein Ace3 n=1 Tax=Hyalella azteca TaxID=294128 RepID=A0A8B7NKJ7_HYAAZ|nr:angiotensin-converting enzyme-like protein Ace3 [Hyalella azteca]